MLKIYNSLTQTKEVFSPREAGKVKLYVCGPTVYDFCHIGNARSFAAFDVVVRYLRFLGLDVTYVRNITDIDDKIIRRANENKESFQAVVDRFTQAMQDDLADLNLLKPTYEPRATEFVPHIIQFIEKLLAKNAAYIAANGDVYYDVRQCQHYGHLSHRNIDELESGARVDISDLKRDPLDFVLWKMAKPNEPKWPSPWGEGRPGWHIECSTMSVELLGAQFDIHGGGRDLIFPHHENEIAQSESVTNQPFVTTWMHAGYLQIDKAKMSKSLGNFFLIRELLKAFPAEVLRYFLISSHYRSSLNFSEVILQQTHHALGRLYTALRELPSANPLVNSEWEQKFMAAMNDDFNTPIAFSVLFELAHEIQRVRHQSSQAAAELGATLKKLGNILGILQTEPTVFLQTSTETVDVGNIEACILARNNARQMKNWAEADRIRDELLAMSIVLEDSSEGTTWKFLST